MIESTINSDQRERQRAKRLGVAPSSSLRRHFLALARQTSQWAKSTLPAGQTVHIGVTSLNRGAGNSTVAYNLAVAMTSIARSRALLVESDFGRHFITRRLGQSRQSGLSELLTASVEMQDVVAQTPIANLDVIGCGQVAEQIALELPFDELPSVMAEHFSDYGFTFFDLPLANHLTAFYPMASALDGIILTVEANLIDQKLISRFRTRMQSMGIPVIGMVMNKQ